VKHSTETIATLDTNIARLRRLRQWRASRDIVCGPARTRSPESLDYGRDRGAVVARMLLAVPVGLGAGTSHDAGQP
jgi:hypothetical protein